MGGVLGADDMNHWQTDDRSRYAVLNGGGVAIVATTLAQAIAHSDEIGVIAKQSLSAVTLIMTADSLQQTSGSRALLVRPSLSPL